jgi:hypothetical protein
MENILLRDVLTKEEIQTILELVNKEKESRPYSFFEAAQEGVEYQKDVKVYSKIGRLDIEKLELPDYILDKFDNLPIYDGSEKSWMNRGEVMYAEYSGKYGKSELRPHYDGGNSTYLIDYQLASNTSWAIGIEDDIYEIKDNHALALSPVTQLHWRPVKEFKENEYVAMLFFRFNEPNHTNEYRPEATQERLEEVMKISESYYSNKENLDG